MKNNKKSDWIHNELKTGDPTYDGNRHPERYSGNGISTKALFIIGGILAILGGGYGILFGIVMILIGVFI